MRSTPGQGLTTKSLHIWHIPLLCELTHKGEDYDLLGEIEKVRANSFIDAIAKQKFIDVHVAVRRILASYLSIPVKQLALDISPLDKPILAPRLYDLDLRFNLSHSGDMAVFAITIGADVGIDLEQINIKRKIAGIAQRYFSEQTLDALMSLAEPQQKMAFLRVWTQYEAYKKAQGQGLRGGDPKLSFALNEYPANQFRPLFPEQTPSTWRVAGLNLSAKWVGAVVVQHRKESIKISDFEYNQAGIGDQ